MLLGELYPHVYLNMKVSIIMPYYNAAAYIHETVEAIIDQTFQDWELIIVDDCSPAPETANVLDQVKAMDNRIKVIHAEKNGGAGLARNIGIKAVDISAFAIVMIGGILQN
mgnify:CR=1 FL=1